MNNELKPCPFCGCKKPNIIGCIDFDRTHHVTKNYFYVVCPRCRIQTDDTDTPEEAVKMWNRQDKGRASDD